MIPGVRKKLGVNKKEFQDKKRTPKDAPFLKNKIIRLSNYVYFCIAFGNLVFPFLVIFQLTILID